MSSLVKRPPLIDVVVAVALAVATVITTIPLVENGPARLAVDPLGIAVIACTALSLSFRRQWPVSALVATITGTTIYTLLGYPFGPIVLLLWAAVGTVAAFRSRKIAVICCALVIAAHVPYALFVTQTTFLEVAINATWLVLATAAGMAFKQARQSRLRAVEAERSRYLSDERLLIAREVHDVLGHSLAVINMHAGVALHVLNTQEAPPEVVQSLQAIRTSGTEALEELRATLAPLSQSDDRRPTRGLAAVADLVDTVSSETLEVNLDVSGKRRSVPHSVDTAAFRIIQEALTNVVKHSQARNVTVNISYQASQLNVSVNDDGLGAGELNAGHGLTGMRERAEYLGGRFNVQNGPNNGFGVQAELPYVTVET